MKRIRDHLYLFHYYLRPIFVIILFIDHLKDPFLLLFLCFQAFMLVNQRVDYLKLEYIPICPLKIDANQY